MTVFSPSFANRMVHGQMVVHFQRYKLRPKVKAGNHYAISPRSKRPDRRSEPSIGRYLVKSVDLVRLNEISQNDAQAAGFVDTRELRTAVAAWHKVEADDLKPDTYLWRIEWEIIQREDDFRDVAA
jgi:hypothetical protein